MSLSDFVMDNLDKQATQDESLPESSASTELTSADAPSQTLHDGSATPSLDLGTGSAAAPAPENTTSVGPAPDAETDDAAAALLASQKAEVRLLAGKTLV